MNTLTLSVDSELTWNGTPISKSQLEELLVEAATMENEPQLMYLPDPYANYEESAELLTLMRKSGITRLGFIGNEKLSESDAN